MAFFDYTAYDSSGGKQQGIIEADSQAGALAQLKKQGLMPSVLKEQKDQAASINLFGDKISLSDIEFLTAELSLLLESGVKIDKGIDIIRKSKAKASLAKLLSSLSKSLQKGQNLSQACRQHPEVFDELYCNLIELGEASGNLSEIFADLAKDLKFKRELRGKIISSLTYPSVIFAVCILSIVFIFNFIIPKMATMFNEVENLPWYTQAMLSASDWMVNYQTFLLFGIIAAMFGIGQGLKQPRVQKWWQEFSLKLPVIHTAIITVERIRLNNGLAMMIKSGVQIDRALALSAGNIKNLHLRREVDIARKKVKQGSAITPALKQTRLYPDFFISLLEVGEESGNMQRVFSEIASRSRQEFEDWTTRITTLLEPLMILFMGVIVGGAVVMMLLSMVSINDFGL